MSIYTFWYCTFHDDGYLINTDTHTHMVPDWHPMCNSSKCTSGDWTNKGVLQIDLDTQAISELCDITMDYERYGGGFDFKYYSYGYYVKTSPDIIPIEPDTTLGNWFCNKISD